MSNTIATIKLCIKEKPDIYECIPRMSSICPDTEEALI